jgi:hypothetical protein
MHGYAHNRACQLSFHPKYVSGTGIEDFETCERFFSISNNCAGITRYTTSFHRLQLLDTHFHDHDADQRLILGKTIYKKYKEAGERITNLTGTFKELKLDEQVKNGTYESYLKAEAMHIYSLKMESSEEQARFNYLSALERYWAASSKWEDEATRAGINPQVTVIPTKPLPKSLKDALRTKNEAAADVGHFERMLGIDDRWEINTPEYIEVKKLSSERKYRLALNRVERLLIQRLFELQKANLVSTGKFFLYSKGFHLNLVL